MSRGPWISHPLIRRHAAGLLERKRLVVVADGALPYVLFAALPDPSLARDLLLERHEIVSLPSASVLALQRQELAGRPRAAKQIAVFADRGVVVDVCRAKGPQPQAPRFQSQRRKTLTKGG